MRAEEHCHTLNVGKDSTRVQDGSVCAHVLTPFPG